MDVLKIAQGQSGEEMVKKILVVDDEPDICFVLKTLGENGFMIDSYEDPTLALDTSFIQLSNT